MMDKIYEEQKVTNRSLRRISNLILMAMFVSLGNDAKARNDEDGAKLCLIGMGLTTVSYGLSLVTDVIEIIKSRNQIKSSE